MSYLRHYFSTAGHKYWVAWYLICFIARVIRTRFQRPVLLDNEIEKLSLCDFAILYTTKRNQLMTRITYADATALAMLCLNTGEITFVPFIFQILKRAVTHDMSKFSISESKGFSRFTHELKNIEYGTPQYKLILAKLKPTIDLHYSRNAHHPEYSGNRNILGMNWFDFIEMFYDWKAAGKRGKDGDISKSILVQQAKLGLDTHTVAILMNSI